MDADEVVHVLLLVAKFYMTTPAYGHKIGNFVFFATSAHAPAMNMMNVLPSITANFAQDYIISHVAEVVHIVLDMPLHNKYSPTVGQG